MIQQPKKLLELVRDAISHKNYAHSTEKTKFYRDKRFVLSHDKRHLPEMGAAELPAMLMVMSLGNVCDTPCIPLGCGWHRSETGFPFSRFIPHLAFQAVFFPVVPALENLPRPQSGFRLFFVFYQTLRIDLRQFF